MKTYKVKTFYGEYNVVLTGAHYTHGNRLAIQLVDPEEGPFATLTVNLPDNSVSVIGATFVDTNNCPWAIEFIRENELGTFTGNFGFSGYCAYPEYLFDLSKINMRD